MFNKQSLKLGLTGAILFIIVGSVTACDNAAPTEPAAPQYTDAGSCVIVNGNLQCSN